MDNRFKYRDKIIAVSMFICFFITNYIILYILHELGIDLSKTSLIVRQIVNLAINLVFPIILIIVYRKELLTDLKKIKKEYSKYLEVGIPFYILGLIGMVLSNFILQFVFKLGIAANESAVRNIINSMPVYAFVSACILAPFEEEMIFRKCIRKLINNKYLFILTSGLIFGAMHIIGTVTNITDWLFILPYGFLGCTFAYIYYKTDNIFVTIFIHLLHNTILVLLQIGMGM